VLDLGAEHSFLFLVEGFRAGDVICAGWVLGYEGALAQEGQVFSELFFLGEEFDAGHQLVVGKAF
jgi:hypothetical protein